jgi:hypothetical protein
MKILFIISLFLGLNTFGFADNRIVPSDADDVVLFDLDKLNNNTPRLRPQNIAQATSVPIGDIELGNLASTAAVQINTLEILTASRYVDADTEIDAGSEIHQRTEISRCDRITAKILLATSALLCGGLFFGITYTVF